MLVKRSRDKSASQQTPRYRGIVIALGAGLTLACAGGAPDAGSAAKAPAAGQAAVATVADTGVLTLFNAGSLAGPLKAAFDTFAAGSPLKLAQENAGSLETARKLTELNHIPDVIALADYETFPQLLMPKYMTWYLSFARNRMVLAYSDRSKGAAGIDSTNWYKVVQQPGIEMGHSNPDLDPAGYRALLVFQLAEAHYQVPGLAAQLKKAVKPGNIRPKSADLVALLQTGEMDYAWEYESVAQAANLKYVRLPAAIDLADPSQAAFYAKAVVRVAGTTPKDTLVITGEPIVYGLSIPLAAPRQDLAQRFVAFLESPRGRAVMQSAKLDALEKPTVTGVGVPALVQPAP